VARRTLAAACCTVTLAAAVLVLPAATTPAVAETGVDDYPRELRGAGRGAVIDPWRFYNRYCTSFVAWRLNDILGGTPGNWKFTNFTGGGQFSNAENWDENARRLGWKVDRNPTVGSVYQTETTSWAGHVAMVTAVDGDRVKLEEYNLGDGAYHHHRWVNWRSDSTADFIHVPGVAQALSVEGASATTATRLSGAERTLAAGPAAADLDGDGADELGIRDGVRVKVADGQVPNVDWGQRSDELFSLDLDGDGRDDLGLRRGNTFLFDTTGDGTVDHEVSFGRAGDLMFTGDFDGDGDDEVGLWRDGRWMLNLDMQWAAEQRFDWGRATDRPVVGDWDGDGTTELGLRRGGVVLLDTRSNRGIDRRIELGAADHTLHVGDFDGNGTDDLLMRDRGWFRYDLDKRGGADDTYWWGRATDVTLTGDFDGDGSTDVALRRGSRFIVDLDLDDAADRTLVWGRADADLLDPR